MPKVVDAARVTTPTNTVWRTCTSCNHLTPLRADTDRCTDCPPPDHRTLTDIHLAECWERVYRYATVVGQIDAWADRIPHVSDAERLTHIREALKTLDLPGRNDDRGDQCR